MPRAAPTALLLLLAAAAACAPRALAQITTCLKLDPNCAPGTCYKDAPEYCATCKKAGGLQWVFGNDGLCRAPVCTDDWRLGCKDCQPSNPMRCKSCLYSDYKLTSSGACVSISDCTGDPAQGCATCATDNVFKCATCKQANYIVNASGYCVASTPLCRADAKKGCATCSASAPLKCATCTNRTFVVNAAGTCVASCRTDAKKGCATCSAIDPLKCATCANSTHLVNSAGGCTPAAALINCLSTASKGCRTCRAAPNVLKCATCRNAAHIVNAAGVCVASPSPPPPRPPPPAVTCLNDATKRCATCQAAPNQLRCATCATAGWTVNAAGVCVAPAQDPTACLATVANCHTCNNWYPSLCYQCNAGYLLRNNQCQPTASGWGTSWRNA